MAPINPPRTPERGPCDPEVEDEPAIMPEEAPVYVPEPVIEPAYPEPERITR